MSITENELRSALDAGRPVFGASVSTFAPNIVEILGEIGFDFAWLDFEHSGPSPYDSTVFEDLTRAAEVGNIELLVRLPAPDPPLVRKVLDSGVRNILLPRIETAYEVERAVSAAYYSYSDGIGDRGVGVGRTSNWGGSMSSLVEQEQNNAFVGAMIENRQAVDNLDEILAVDNLGFVFIGPADLSVSLGHPLDTENLEVQSTVEEIFDRCLSSGVPVGCIRNNSNSAKSAVEEGYGIIRIGGDISSVRNELTSRLESIKSDIES